jgi:hypothetical protein
VTAGILTDEVLSRLATEIIGVVDDATEYAESQPDPQPSTAMRWVYAEDWPSETPPAWGLGGTSPHEDEGAGPGGEGISRSAD